MDIFLRITAGILLFLGVLLRPVFWLRSRGKRRYLPPIKNEIVFFSATDLAEKIRTKKITSEKVCRCYIDRIKEVNPILNAIVEECFEKALEEARKVDDYLQTTNLNTEEIKECKPLLGVPITVKESCSLAGSSLCVGSLNRVGIKADCDGEVVARLKASGAIPLLVSNTPELCLSWESNNYITGRTNNAYDTTRTSSGSSGGEGALLGAGASVIGIGSDIAGSIRLPAMFNGVFGHKPTARLIPIKGHYPYCNDESYADYLVIGPLTRYAKDLVLMTKIMAGENSKNAHLNKKIDIHGNIRVYFMKDIGFSVVLPGVQNEIKRAITKSVYYLKENCGAEIMEDKFEELSESLEIGSSVLFGLKDIPNLLKGESQNLPTELLKNICGLSKYSLNLLYFYTMQYLVDTFVGNEYYKVANGQLRQILKEKLGDDGVLLFPTFPTSAFRHDEIYLKIMGVLYLMIFNTTGLPATHIPCGTDKNGLPIGIQVIASPNNDRLCLAVAEELEKCFGGWIPPPAK